MNLLSCFIPTYFLLLCSVKLSAAHSNHNDTSVFNPYKTTAFNLLVGALKGDRKPGIGNVKSYLHRLGYYPFVKEAGKCNNDLFDDALETAVLAYQKFFKLNNTGVLDYDTISMMSTGRCGNHDILRNIIINEHFPSRYHLFSGRPHRTKSHLYVRFPDNIFQEHKNAIYQAFRDWESLVPVIFLESSDPDLFDINIGFFKGYHGDSVTFDGKDGILAHASRGQGSTFHFDSEENWRVGAVPDGYDLQTVARHEIGHLLGLDHSEDESSVMHPQIHPGTIKMITGDDIAGIKDLYGTSE